MNRRVKPKDVDADAFMEQLEENEKTVAEQAALAMTCEMFGISYMDGDYIKVFEKYAELHPECVTR